MKLYSECATASMAMAADPRLTGVMKAAINEKRVDAVIETGTFEGRGSTTLIAECFADRAPPRAFVTIEANWASWRRARMNLADFPFVNAVWGGSVPVDEALAFIRSDEWLLNHHNYPDVFIDDVDDPVAFYSREILGGLGGEAVGVRGRILKCIDRLLRYHGEDLLRRYLRRYRSYAPLVVLDSAGGIGFLEFSILRDTMRSSQYLVLLDDIQHIKHYRSAKHIYSDPAFCVLGVSEDNRSLLASHPSEAIGYE